MTPVLDHTDIERFRAIVARRFGLQYDNGKLDFLADVLRQRMEAARSPRFDAYVEHLASSPRRSDELRALAAQLTVAETFFFRNADNFRAFAEHVLPERIRSRAREKRLRILSAGCASGEEAYSLAVQIREALPDLASWDVRIIGIDINPSMLVKAAQARYSTWSLRATSEDAKRRYFREDGRDFVLDPAVQKMVTFEERNLVDEDPVFWQSSSYDVVFCRNVIMYFTPEIMREVVRRLGQALLPGGFLFLGHAETLRGLSQEFHLCHTHDTFYYQRRDGAEAPIKTVTSSETPRDQIADTLPAVVDTTASWVDVIQHASERIASLAKARARWDADAPPTIGAAAIPVTRSWNLGLVLEAMRQERFSDALALLSALPPDSHGEPDALLLRAALLTNSGRLEEAEDACTRLLALDELNAGAHYLMALCREHAGDAAGAAEHDQTAVYLDTGFAMPHLHLGLVAKRSGDVATAQRELGQALILLAREDASRFLLFGGGFSRETLLQLCRTELRAVGGDG
jgi:chemotaxis protein methyltransferase CheR